MRIQFLIECKINEIESRLLIDQIIGWCAFLVGVFFDPIAKKFAIQHQEGFNLYQIIWCSLSAIYLIWTIYQWNKWKE